MQATQFWSDLCLFYTARSIELKKDILMKKIVFMYSGQGSHYYQMAMDLYDNNATFKQAMLKANDFYQSIMHQSIIDSLYNDQHTKSTPFTNILLTHPAIFMVEYALTQVMFEQNIRPDIVLCSSLGEFAGAVAAGILDFETAFSLVIKQAKALVSCPPAGMLAIVQSPDLYKTQPFLNENSELSALNFSTHFVISGRQEALNEIVLRLNEKNITSIHLNVLQGFHSRWIDSARDIFLEGLEGVVFKKPVTLFFSSTYAEYKPNLTTMHFWEVIRKPILFQQSIELLEKEQPLMYIDIGPQGTLATFVKYNLTTQSQSKPYPIITMYGNAQQNINIIKSEIK